MLANHGRRRAGIMPHPRSQRDNPPPAVSLERSGLRTLGRGHSRVGGHPQWGSTGQHLTGRTIWAGHFLKDCRQQHPYHAWQQRDPLGTRVRRKTLEDAMLRPEDDLLKGLVGHCVSFPVK
jgi:hypothetical protein